MTNNTAGDLDADLLDPISIGSPPDQSLNGFLFACADAGITRMLMTSDDYVFGTGVRLRQLTDRRLSRADLEQILTSAYGPLDARRVANGFSTEWVFTLTMAGRDSLKVHAEADPSGDRLRLVFNLERVAAQEPQGDAEIAAALVPLAENLRAAQLPFADRYDRLLERAFRLGGLQLNNKRLREIAGGGSATTAQDAIERFRRKLLTFFGARAELDLQMPPALATSVSEFAMQVWEQSQQLARAAFNEDKAVLDAQVATAQRNEKALRETMENQVERILALTESGRRELSRADALAGELEAEKQRSLQLQSDLEERLARAVQLADTNRQEATRALTDASEAKAALLRQERATADALQVASREHMVEMDRLRTAHKAADAMLRADLSNALARGDSLATKVSEQSVELATLKAQTTAEIAKLGEHLELAATTGAAAAATAHQLGKDLAARDATIAELRASNQELLASLRTPAPPRGKNAK